MTMSLKLLLEHKRDEGEWQTHEGERPDDEIPDGWRPLTAWEPVHWISEGRWAWRRQIVLTWEEVERRRRAEEEGEQAEARRIQAEEYKLEDSRKDWRADHGCSHQQINRLKAPQVNALAVSLGYQGERMTVRDALAWFRELAEKQVR